MNISRQLRAFRRQSFSWRSLAARASLVLARWSQSPPTKPPSAVGTGAFLSQFEQAVTPPPDYAATKKAASAIEGMLSDFSMAAMDALLCFQEARGARGHAVEFGVFHGRSAAISGAHVRPDERLLLIDIADYFDRAALTAICPHAEFILSASETFKGGFRDFAKLAGQCQFIHIDSSHTFRTTLCELALAEELVGDKGMVVLDDFANLNYSQILASTYKYLYTKPTRLTPFLITSAKAYLCRQSDFAFFGDFVLNEMAEEMSARENGEYCIARTDSDPEYRAFHLRLRESGETGRFYGYHLYGHLVQKP